MESRVGLWGGSCAVRIPKMAVQSLGLHEGEVVTLTLEDGALVLRPLKRGYTLDELVQQAKVMTPPDGWDDDAAGDEAL